MNLLAFLARWQPHSVAGLALTGGYLWLLFSHPDTFTPESYTKNSLALLSGIAAISAAKDYQHHRLNKSKAPEPLPHLPLAQPNPNPKD